MNTGGGRHELIGRISGRHRNPLAVVFEAKGLGDREMQAIAREMNCSETAFLLPPARGDWGGGVGIFPPRARAAVRGASDHRDRAWVLAREKLLPSGATRFNLEEGIGPVEVTLEGEPTAPSFLWMRHGEATFGSELTNRAAFARALGLAESDLLAGAPICTGSTGNTFLYVPLRDRDAVDRARLDVPALLAAEGEGPNLGLFVFAPDPDPHARRVYSRMFAPHTSGVPEDPATGSASGALCAYLIERGLVAAGSTVDIVSEQGTRMGRQSFIQIRIATSAGRITEVLVGGRVVPVIEGRLRVP